MINIRIGVVTPSLNLDWVLTAVLKDISEYKLWGIEVTETLLYSGYRIVAKIQLGKESMSKMLDAIDIEGG